MTQSADLVTIRLASQLIKGISKVFQKLISYLNDTAIYYRTTITSTCVHFNLHLNSNDLESVLLPSASSLQYRHKLPGDFE